MPPVAAHRRPHALPVAVAFALALLVACLAAGRAAAQATPAEVALAERHAPVVMIPEGRGCEGGRPYDPVDVDVLLGNDVVALRGPWNRTDLVRTAPDAADLGRGLFDYHLDFPGDTLAPGCDFELWSERLAAKGDPTAYARVVTEPGRPGKLALQYWFFYVFNDWNNNHEGDWEMIQLLFDADTPAEALGTDPVEAGYSQHSSGERAAWGDAKLQVVDGTHPVVWPAAGSHANFFDSELYLMRSQAEGVGCDDTRTPAAEVRPAVVTVPTDPAAYRREFPWLAFEGRWGEEQVAFFNGPTGPNMKTQWTTPVTWAEEDLRERSFTVPSDGIAIGPTATGVFCTTVAAGSEALRRAKTSPGVSLAVLGGAALLLLWALSRTRWSPATVLPGRRRRTGGQLLSSSWRTYRAHPRVFLGIGLAFVPVGVAATLLQYLLFRVLAFTPLVDEAGETNAFVALLVLALGVLVSFLGLAVVQAAVSRAMVDLEAGRRVTARSAYRAIAPRLVPELRAMLVVVVVMIALFGVVVLVPVGVWLLVRWSLFAVIAGMEPDPPARLLRRSWGATRRHWWRVASIALGVTGAGLLTGPLIGTAALLVSSASFDLINLVSALVYVAVLPLPAIAMTYLVGDLAARAAEPVPAAAAAGTAPGDPPPAAPGAAPA
jgi:hypothetical protein